MTNVCFENVWKIDMFLKEQSESRDQVIRDMVLHMRVKFDKYWSECILLFAFAIIINPKCKKASLKYCSKEFSGDDKRVNFKLTQVGAKLETLLQEYTKCINPPTNVASTPSSSTIGKSLEAPPHKQKFGSSTSQAKVQLFNCKYFLSHIFLIITNGLTI